MKYDVEPKILGYRDEWDRNSDEILITFESLEPFYDAGINYGQLNKRVHARESQNTLFVNKDTNNVLKSGWALFRVQREDDWPIITFVEMQSEVDIGLDNRLANIERSIEDLKDLVKRFVNS